MWQRVRLSEDGKLPQCSLALARPALPWAALREWAVKRLLVGLWWVRPGVRSRAGFCSPPGPRGPIGSRGSLHLCSHAELWTGGELMGASFLLTAILDVSVLPVLVGCAVFGLVTAKIMERKVQK